MGQVGFALIDNSNLVRAYLNHSDPQGGGISLGENGFMKQQQAQKELRH